MAGNEKTTSSEFLVASLQFKVKFELEWGKGPKRNPIALINDTNSTFFLHPAPPLKDRCFGLFGNSGHIFKYIVLICD